MPTKHNAAALQEATEVFRQFAWHLAGSLVTTAGKGGRAATPAPAKGAGQRAGKSGGKR